MKQWYIYVCMGACNVTTCIKTGLSRLHFVLDRNGAWNGAAVCVLFVFFVFCSLWFLTQLIAAQVTRLLSWFIKWRLSFSRCSLIYCTLNLACIQFVIILWSCFLWCSTKGFNHNDKMGALALWDMIRIKYVVFPAYVLSLTTQNMLK